MRRCLAAEASPAALFHLSFFVSASLRPVAPRSWGINCSFATSGSFLLRFTLLHTSPLDRSTRFSAPALERVWRETCDPSTQRGSWKVKVPDEHLDVR